MIYLYSGTPGSGKSLHAARVIYYRVKHHRHVISNFPVDTGAIKGKGDRHYTYLDNSALTPAYLVQYGQDNFVPGRDKEGKILLLIDEAQLLFNSRDWGRKDRADWLTFFTQHRHWGYDIVLIAQFDRMLDRQIRSLIEYEVIHRKVNNYGIVGRLIGLVCLTRPVFCFVRIWYPMRTKVGSEFTTGSRKYYRMYNSYDTFDASG